MHCCHGWIYSSLHLVLMGFPNHQWSEGMFDWLQVWKSGQFSNGGHCGFCTTTYKAFSIKEQSKLPHQRKPRWMTLYVLDLLRKALLLHIGYPLEMTVVTSEGCSGPRFLISLLLQLSTKRNRMSSMPGADQGNSSCPVWWLNVGQCCSGECVAEQRTAYSWETDWTSHVGHFCGSFNHIGPCHHTDEVLNCSKLSPLVRRSAWLSAVRQCLQVALGISCISLTLGLIMCGSDLVLRSQNRTIGYLSRSVLGCLVPWS